MTETTKATTLRQALRAIREELRGVEYLSSAQHYECDRGTLIVSNRKSSGGGLLLGLFQAELVDKRFDTIRVYEV